MGHQKNNTELYAIGKTMPNATELEEAVLGALMISRDAVTSVMDIVTPDTFYHNSHKVIYRAILDLFTACEPVDILTVSNKLRKGGELDSVGGSVYLAELTNRVASAANVEYHSRILAQKYIMRRVIEAGTKAVKAAYEDHDDAFDVLESAERDLFSIWNNNESKGATQLAGPALEALKTAHAAAQAVDGVVGVPSGLLTLDKVTGGYKSPDLIIIAARPGMGKTALAMNAAFNAAKNGHPVAVFSLEMSKTQLANRILASYTGINSHRLSNGNLHDYEWQELQTAVEQMASIPLYIDDNPGMTVYQMMAACRRLKMKHGIKMVVVDYIQLMEVRDKPKGQNREQDVSQISRGLKLMAKELEVPVIALSQLSRAVETRGGTKRPILSDLRESGAVEQDADIVAFIYRPEYYEIMEDENGQSLKGIAEIIFAKHRNGGLGGKKVGWKDATTTFFDLDENQPVPATIATAATQFPATARPSQDNEDIPF